MTGEGLDRRGGFGWPVAGSLLALLLSPLAEALTGNEMFYTVPVLGLFVLFWALTRMSLTEIGFRLGDLNAYAVSFAYPLILLSLAAGAAAVGGDTEIDTSSVGEVTSKILIMFAATWLGSLITEEGLFRGWLWGAVSRPGMRTRIILIWTALVFGLWHLPVAVMEENFRLPVEVIPVYIINVCLLGMAWGIIRFASGSIVVTAFCHGVWNGIVYIMFGYGTNSAALGMTRYRLFDPERGLAGLVLNGIAIAVLWRWAAGRAGRQSQRSQ